MKLKREKRRDTYSFHCKFEEIFYILYNRLTESNLPLIGFVEVYQTQIATQEKLAKRPLPKRMKKI